MVAVRVVATVATTAGEGMGLAVWEEVARVAEATALAETARVAEGGDLRVQKWVRRVAEALGVETEGEAMARATVVAMAVERAVEATVVAVWEEVARVAEATALVETARVAEGWAFG